jgi:hypothetical protein
VIPLNAPRGQRRPSAHAVARKIKWPQRLPGPKYAQRYTLKGLEGAATLPEMVVPYYCCES